ncbi:MAG: hypothetical protein SFU83_18585 [Meiothermus sp.]|nr:hypothetical protein [Meiothermus sp.]
MYSLLYIWRISKWLEEYTRLPSMQTYAIVAQTQRQVVLYE